MKEYNKLVRDRIPEIIAAAGNSCTTRTLSKVEYMQALDAKLYEEMDEYQLSHEVAELVDLLEVIYAAAAARGFAAEELDALREEKAAKRGRFEKRILLESVYEKPQPQRYTLDEIARKICKSYDKCDEDCVGFDCCSKYHNGALAWLRKVVENEKS
jgi:predicted house-cleaning noncanonical NTP pyrophosphatase (MazG superfamily)